MREARSRWIAIVAVLALLAPSAAHAGSRAVRRVLPKAAASAAAAQSLNGPAEAPALRAAVERLASALNPDPGQSGSPPGALDGIYLARSASGHVRALMAPPGRTFAVSSPGADRSPQGLALTFLGEHRVAFGWSKAGSSLQAGSIRTRAGRTFVRFEQRFAGLRVFGAAAVVQVEASGGVAFVLADLARDDAHLHDPGFRTEPQVGSDKAVEVARGLVPADHRPVDLAAEPPELMVYEPSVIGNAGPSQLVWDVRVRSATAAVNEVVLVDAETGAAAFHYSDVKEAKARQIFDSANVVGSLGTLVRSEGDPPVGSPADVDLAYDYLGDTYDFYFTRFGRDSYDGAGGTLLGRVRWCEPGSACPYSSLYWNGSEMHFGDGYASADDLVAHELTHGVTEHTSNLIYWSEAGAIDEGISDIFGEFVDLTNGHGTDTPAVRWLIGEDLPGGAIRNMADPTVFAQPDRRFSAYWHTDADDNRGVHTNSGVANKLAYLLTDGDTFNGQTVAGQGIDEVARLFYEAETDLLVPASDYYDLYAALRQAAINIGWSGSAYAALEAASRAVEIDLPGVAVPVFTDGFEGTFPGAWQVSICDPVGTPNPTCWSSGEGTQWGRSSFRKASGSFSAYCAAGGTSPAPPGGPYAPNMNTWMVYGPFTLASVLEAWAEFDLYLDVEPGFDDIFWGVSTDGVNFDGYAVSPPPDGYTTGIGGTPGWAHELFEFKGLTDPDTGDPVPVLGQTQVWLAFNFTSDNIVQYEGAYLDNVAINKAIAQSADLAVTKTDGVSQVIAGQHLTYTIRVSNAGPDPVANARVVDAFPNSLTGVNWTCSASAGSSCLGSSGSGGIDRIVSLAVGGNVTFVATATLDPAATGTLVNAASVSLPNGFSDPVPGNNTAVDTDTIVTDPTQVDLAITKAGPAFAVRGGNIVYTTVVTNNGPASATSVRVDDPAPSGLTLVSNAGDCSTAFPCSLGTMTPGQTLTISSTFSVPINYPAPTPIVNTATVSSATIDPSPENDSATATSGFGTFFTLAPCRLADTRDSKSPNGPPALQPGQDRTFVLSGTCGLPAGATAVSVNVTVAGGTAPGNLRLFPADVPLPLVSTINFVAGQTRANNAIVAASADGTVSIKVHNASVGPVQLILDVNGYFE